MDRRHFFVSSLPVLVGGALAAMAAQAKPSSKMSEQQDETKAPVSVRPATADDVPRMVALSEMMRTQYARYSPRFWRRAQDASQKQLPFFQAQLARGQNIALVAEEAGQVQGFIIAGVTTAPPVYDPGGSVCMIDDFAVSTSKQWRTVGQALLAVATTEARSRGAVISVVVCGHLDEPKRAMLRAWGASIASEWYTKPIA